MMSLSNPVEEIICMSKQSDTESKFIDFGNCPYDSVSNKSIQIQNVTKKTETYRVSFMYIMDTISCVFKASITSSAVNPNQFAVLTIEFKPNVVDQTFTEYYAVEDTSGNVYRITVTGRCFGPEVVLSKKKIVFRVLKNILEYRSEVVHLINKSSFDITYQWLLPFRGKGYFQVTNGECGLINGHETISMNIIFTGTSLGVYTAELVCLVQNQEPIFLDLIATVTLNESPTIGTNSHVFEQKFKRKTRSAHLMENSLRILSCFPQASVSEQYLDFGTGHVTDNTRNVTHSISVTNHGDEDGIIQWMCDPENIFIIDPLESVIPPQKSRMFTIRFRPKGENDMFGFLMCGDFRVKVQRDSDSDIKHTWFRIPCIGNTWETCFSCQSDYSYPPSLYLPPTVPGRSSFANFMLSNKLFSPMLFTFIPPSETKFSLFPMCGIVASRGWGIITVALEPKEVATYYEYWELMINNSPKVRVVLCGNAEISQIEVMADGTDQSQNPMYEFEPTTTGCVSYATAYLRNKTRMPIHLRVINYSHWLGADNQGYLTLSPYEVVKYNWWFFPDVPDKVYETTVVCSCVCLIGGKPVGETTEVFIHLIGFSELPDLRALPKRINMNDICVEDTATTVTNLFNYGTCCLTFKLYFVIDGMGDDHSNDRLDISPQINKLNPSEHCEVKFAVTPLSAGPRQITITYKVLYCNEHSMVEEILARENALCIVWYDGIYPTLQVKRTISVKCPLILSNHCVWNITNVDELNKALKECRPNKSLSVNLYGPDLCVDCGKVELIFVLGCLYNVPISWNLRRVKICECEMAKIQTGISFFEMRHTCFHRALAVLNPTNGMVSQCKPGLLQITLDYSQEGHNILCFVLNMPNQRSIYLYFNIQAYAGNKGMLCPLRRFVDYSQYMAVLNCGRVPINNLDHVIRIVWLYNPTNVYTTWRLLKMKSRSMNAIKCLLYFAEVPPLEKLAIPFAFLPIEMVYYEAEFACSYGYDTVKILVRGEGGLPNCYESRLDMPNYVEKVICNAYRNNQVYLSKEHITLPLLPTHSLIREIISISNTTEDVMRYIWLPERIPNILNVVMSPCWGILQPHSEEWITVTVYTLQEPATFTATLSCELLNLTARSAYHKNEIIRKNKLDQCRQEFIITERGTTYPGINDYPPYVLELEKPKHSYISFTLAVSSKGQRDGYSRLLLNQMWTHTPAYDLLSSDTSQFGHNKNINNTLKKEDTIRIIDGILWDALHSKMFKNQIKFYSSEEIPTYQQLSQTIDSKPKASLSRRVTSGICDALVNKAVYSVYNLNKKQEPFMEA